MPTRALLLLAAATVVAGCGRDGFPWPNVPQVEHSVERGRRERFAAYRACVRAAPELEPLLQCMEAAGWVFISRLPEYPHIECWQLRDAGGPELPPVYCWERAGSEPSGR
jgi:hypothetical protein